MTDVLNFLSAYLIPVFVVAVPLYALFFKKVPIYSSFTEGAKEGFETGIMIIPYLVAMLCAIGMFRASGAMDQLVAVLEPVTSIVNMPAEVLPMGLMRSLSGGGAQGLCADLLETYGTQSQIGRVASVAFGSTETTFYVLAVYFGAVGVTNTRQSMLAGIAGDLFSLIMAAIIVNIMWF